MTSDVDAVRAPRPRYSQAVIVGFVFVAIAGVCLLFADLSVTTLDPWAELGRMARGLAKPDFFAIDTIGMAILQTIAFALVGVALAAVAGFVLAQFFYIGPVRWACAFIRAIHELFWALIFLQVLGLSPLTGILAIAIPYAGICAKVYAETLEEAPPAALKALPAGVSTISTFFYVRLPDAWVHIKNYTFYRFECGLRSSAVLGFVGLPTLGYYLETDFSEGNYSEAAALLIVFYVIIATLRFWVRPRLLGIYLIIAPFLLGGSTDIRMTNITRFFTEDIVPAPLRDASLFDPQTWSAFGDWLAMLLTDQAMPGLVATVLLTQIALVGTAILALAFFPLISEKFFDRISRSVGHLFLVVVRSTPEFILVYIFLQLWGPSMLPAIVALALHNGAIIGHLLGRHTEQMTLRMDAPKGLNLYFYEIVPRIYGQLMAFLFYRWEVILRETAILGILGIATLGFYVDSAFADIRFDRALFLIFVTALLNIAVDTASRMIRARLRLKTTIEHG